MFKKIWVEMGFRILRVFNYEFQGSMCIRSFIIIQKAMKIKNIESFILTKFFFLKLIPKQSLQGDSF